MEITPILKELQGLSEIDALQYFVSQYPQQVVFSTSFGWEDQVISQMIFAHQLPIKVFTLETGRTFKETYYTWNRTLETYQKPIEVYSAQPDLLQPFLTQKGPNSFYESVENRKECCYIRKVEPLKRALQGHKIWITGIRKEQSSNREDMQCVEWDAQNQLIKFHPLFDWTLAQVKEYVNLHQIPYNPLHDKGFPSIGCEPCTRAVQEGEDFRAGRWWWEDQSKKECGLHAT